MYRDIFNAYIRHTKFIASLLEKLTTNADKSLITDMQYLNRSWSLLEWSDSRLGGQLIARLRFVDNVWGPNPIETTNPIKKAV